MVCSISNIKVKKHIQSIKDSHERGNIGENPDLAFFGEDLEYF